MTRLSKFFKKSEKGEREVFSPFGISPFDASKVIRKYFRETMFFSGAKTPDKVSGFEDLIFLFGSSQANFGLCLLALEEAAHLWKLVRSLDRPRVAEIGRFKGGTTYLLASALDGGSLDSVDLPASEGRESIPCGDRILDGTQLDAQLTDALRKAGLAERVNLISGDSRAQRPAPQSYDVVFIDGDHSYEGAKADYEAWRDAVKIGGHLLLHDVVRASQMIKGLPELQLLLEEVLGDAASGFDLVGTAGSIADLRRKA